MKVLSENGLPIKSRCNNPEDGAIEQMIELSRLPFAFKHIAIMPDTHQGYGMPIGGVMATIEPRVEEMSILISEFKEKLQKRGWDVVDMGIVNLPRNSVKVYGVDLYSMVEKKERIRKK